MHILYIHQYFKTPEEGGAIRSYYLAKGLVDAGHTVTMLTAHSGSKYKKMFVNGIHVHYLPVPYRQSMGNFARIKAFLKFVWLVCNKASLFKKADVLLRNFHSPHGRADRALSAAAVQHPLLF